MKNRTLVILKPEALENHLIGKILQFFDDAKLGPVAFKQFTPSAEQMKKHYRDAFVKYGEDVGNAIVNRMIRGDNIFIVFQDNSNISIIPIVRKFVGATNPQNAEPGTIRALYAPNIEYTMIHASDSVESAEHEISIWFPELN